MIFGDELGGLAFEVVGRVEVGDDGRGEMVVSFGGLGDGEEAVFGGIAAGILFAVFGSWAG